MCTRASRTQSNVVFSLGKIVARSSEITAEMLAEQPPSHSWAGLVARSVTSREVFWTESINSCSSADAISATASMASMAS